MLKKSGTIDGNSIRWTVTVNTSKIDISGWKLSDVMNGAAYTGSVTISPNPATGNGSITTNLPYTFPAGSKTVTFAVRGVFEEDDKLVNRFMMMCK